MVSIRISNTKKLIAAFDKYGDDAVKELGSVTKIRAQEIAIDAKNNASTKRVWDKGDLAQNIRSEQRETPLDYKITAYMPYSAYHEFGTGGSVNIPKGWETMAAQFKGKGVRQVNILARPFMYPAFVKGRSLYKKDINNSLKELAKKFNNG